MTIIWCIVPEIWSVMDIIFCHFGPFFAFLPPQKPEKSKFWRKRKKHLETLSFYKSIPKILIICYPVPEIWHMTDVIVIFILGYFLPFYPPNSPKNQNFKKMKNNWRYHHFTHVYQKLWLDKGTISEIWCVTDEQTDRKSDI